MAETMQGVVNYGAEPGSVELRALNTPEIGDEDVLLEVAAVGVCGSDLHQYQGTHSWKVNYPVVLGHEFAGTVVKTGARVGSFREGERAVSETAAVIDQTSPFSRAGLYNLDPNRLGFGYGVNGAMTRFVRVPERCLHRLPAALPFEKAALTEPCCVAYNACCVHVRIRPGDSVAVLGPGPIGLLCALMARLSGANPLVVYGLPSDAKRLEVARTVGATDTFTGSADEAKVAVKDIGDGYGYDVVIDAAGVSATLKLALDLVRPGGQVSKVGWGPQPYNFSLDPLVAKAVTLQGSFSHNWPIWEKVIGMLGSGQIDLDPVLNAVAPLTEWRSCFDAMHHAEIVKAVLKP
jgi:alcohol dehydrogenase/L-iditol 2-dehydrogenase